MSDTIFARMDTTTQGEGARGGTTNRFHPQGKATHAVSILITYTTPALGRSFIDRAGWFAEQVSGLENGPFSRHIGCRVGAGTDERTACTSQAGIEMRKEGGNTGLG